MPHVVLLLFVAGKDADLLDICLEETLEDGVAEGTGPSGDHQGLVFEKGHSILVQFNHTYRTSSSRS